jgi:hypothetical protein
MKRLGTTAVVFLIAALADAVFLGAQQHGELWWSGISGFFALFGWSGCLAIILLTKYVLGPWLQRHENYYDRGSSG